MKHQLWVYTNTPPLQRPLVPPVGYVQPSQPTNPDLTALHQAHIRSPRLVAADLEYQLPEHDQSRRFYQSIKKFALEPAMIPVTAAVSRFQFTVNEQDFPLIAVDKPSNMGPVPTREFRRGTLQYRLRCVQAQRDTTKFTTPEWVISDTAWPETVYLKINGEHLEVRRKIHHGKDLPVDITRYILPPSPDRVAANLIKVSTPRLHKTLKPTVYFLAVEVIEILQHPQILDMCQQRRIPASQTLDGIKKSLAGPADDDDDFAMVISDLSIDLADPFTARIFDIPVRGNSCLHRECFDLETFLLTRNSKPKQPGQPSLVDAWKCPLCGRDARPYSLLVDDFFVSVRAKLAEDNNLDVKAILISADGTWRPKPEAVPLKRKAAKDQAGDDSEGTDDDEATGREKTTTASAQASRAGSLQANGRSRGSRSMSGPAEVIELD